MKQEYVIEKARHRPDFMKMSALCLKLFILILPFQIRSLIYNAPYLLSGNYNEYASYFIYAGDIFILSALIFFGVAQYYGQASKLQSGDSVMTLLVLLYAGSLFAGVFAAEDKVLAFLHYSRYVEFLFLYFLIVNEVLTRKETIDYFIYAILVQSFIAIEQYLFQSSVGLRFLGEPQISKDIPGVAKVDLGEERIVRAYGTFLHPNILSGFLAVALIWIMENYRKHMWLYLAAATVVLTALIFTFSRSAFVALGGAVLIYFSIYGGKIPFKKIMLWMSVFLLILVLFNLEGPLLGRFFAAGTDVSGEERVEYLVVGRNMLMANPFGYGLGHFTLMMQDFLILKLEPWSTQPVHNVFLLVAAEAGIAAVAVLILLLCYVFYAMLRSHMEGTRTEKRFALVQIAILTVMVTVFMFDHYFYSFYQGQALFFIYLALSSNFASNVLLPSRNS